MLRKHLKWIHAGGDSSAVHRYTRDQSASRNQEFDAVGAIRLRSVVPLGSYLIRAMGLCVQEQSRLFFSELKPTAELLVAQIITN